MKIGAGMTTFMKAVVYGQTLNRIKMVERILIKRDLEQAFKGFEKRQDEKMEAFGKRVIDQFHIISKGLIDQIKLLAEGHADIIERLQLMEKENKRQHLETRSLVKLSFTELDRRRFCNFLVLKLPF
jgi:acetyl-CoA carboxylase carboxyltransferase component